MVKRKTGWTPTMTGHSEQGGQIKCLTSSEGWEYMPDYDSLPAVVRQRLAKSPFNICAACLDIEVREKRGGPPPPPISLRSRRLNGSCDRCGAAPAGCRKFERD